MYFLTGQINIGCFLLVAEVLVLLAVTHTKPIKLNDSDTARHRVHEVHRRSAPAADVAGTLTLQTLKNSSVMVCSEAMNMPYARMIQLSDEQMRDWLEQTGGSYVQDYMAATAEEANENFPNMLMITAPITLQGSQNSFSLLDNLISKQVILEDLHKLTMFLNGYNNTWFSNESQTTSSSNTGTGTSTSSFTTMTQTTSPVTDHVTVSSNQTMFNTTLSPSSTVQSTKHSFINSSEATSTVGAQEMYTTTSTYTNTISFGANSTQRLTTQSKGLANTNGSDGTVSPTSTEAIKQISSLSPAYMTPDRPTVSSATTSAAKAPSTYSSTIQEPVTSTTHAFSLTMTSSVASQRTKSTLATTTLNPKVLQGIEELLKYAGGGSLTSNNTSRLGTRDLDQIWRETGTTLHPATLLGLTQGSSRRRRNADGTVSNEEYCQKKGAPTDDGKFIHLCSLCAVTTKLSDDMFPRYINEAVCKTGDTDCFTVGNTAHGQCKQTMFTLNMLRKKTGQCKMMLHGGETLVFEDWELIPQRIRVACECTINKLSVFSQYVAHDIPVG